MIKSDKIPFFFLIDKQEANCKIKKNIHINIISYLTYLFSNGITKFNFL